MLITFERKVPQSSYTSQIDHKSKGCPSKTSAAAFTMQKADKGDLRRLDFQKSNFPALITTTQYDISPFLKSSDFAIFIMSSSSMGGFLQRPSMAFVFKTCQYSCHGGQIS